MSIQSLVFNILGDSSGADKTLSGMPGKVKGVASAMAGAFAAAGIGQAIMNSMDLSEANAKMRVQLGLGATEAAQAAGAAGQVLATGLTRSTEEANAAVVGVQRNIGTMSQLGQAEFAKMATGSTVLAKAFDQDLGQTTAAVGQLLKTGLAKDGQEAMDILARGFQSGTDKAGDLLDTVTEYGTQFRQLGLDGPTAMGLLNQGLQAGARDADTVADALKEFAIRGQAAIWSTAEAQVAAAERAKAAGESLAQAQRAQVSAQQAVNAARKDAAKNLVDLAANLRNAELAEQSAVQAVARARQELALAKTAEEDLADAQSDSRRAQEDLTDAREDAAKKLRDMSLNMADAQISEREAALALEKARDDLATASYTSGNSDNDIERLKLGVDKAVLSLQNAKNRVIDLSEEQSAAARAGVDGNAQVMAAAKAAAEAKAKEQAAGATAGSGQAAAQLALQQALAGLEDQRRAVAELRADKESADKAGVDGNAQVIAAQQSALDAQQALIKATQDESKARAETGPQLTDLGKAYERIGVDAASSQQAIAAGGPGAAAALANVLDGLRNVQDPAERSALAVTFFGTKAEDMQQALLALDPTTAAAAFGTTAGAAQAAGDVLTGTPKASIDGMKNSIDGWKASLFELPGPLGQVVGGTMAFAPEIAALASTVTAASATFGPLTGGLDLLKSGVGGGVTMAQNFASGWNDASAAASSFTGTAGTLAGKARDLTTSMWDGVSAAGQWSGKMLAAGGSAAWTATKTVALKTATGIATAAQWLWNAAASANPLTLIIIAIAALVAGLIWAYNNVEWFRNGVNAMFEGIGKGVAWMWEGVQAGFKTMVRAIAVLWNMTVGKMEFDIPAWVPLIGGQRFKGPTLQVPALATGGVVTSPTLALIGEAGTEAVVPLDRAGDFGFGGGGGPQIHLTIGSGVIMGTPAEVARQLMTLIQQEVRRGTIPAPAGWGA